MKTGKFLSAYLRAKDLKEPQTVTISTVESETFKDDEKGERIALVVFFKELEQGAVLCRTALAQLIELFGDETDNWTGKKVVVFNDLAVMFKGKRIGGIRFRAV